MKVNNKKQLDQLSNQGNPFINIGIGETTIRLMSDIHAVREHGLEGIGGRKYQAKACPTENARMMKAAGELPEDADIPPCPLCELGYPVSTSYVAAIVQRETEEFNKKGEKVKVGGDAWILKKGPSLMGPLQDLLDNDNWGRTGTYDIVINAAGEGFGRKYSVAPIPAEKSMPITEAEKRSLDALYEKVDLEKMTTPLSYADIKSFVEENKIEAYEPKE